MQHWFWLPGIGSHAKYMHTADKSTTVPINPHPPVPDHYGPSDLLPKPKGTIHFMVLQMRQSSTSQTARCLFSGLYHRAGQHNGFSRKYAEPLKTLHQTARHIRPNWTAYSVTQQGLSSGQKLAPCSEEMLKAHNWPLLGCTSSNTYHPIPFSVCNIKCVAVEVGRKQERRKSCKGEFVITGSVMDWATDNQTGSKGSLNSYSIWRIFWEVLGLQNFLDDISMHQRRQTVSNLGACWPQEVKQR